MDHRSPVARFSRPQLGVFSHLLQTSFFHRLILQALYRVLFDLTVALLFCFNLTQNLSKIDREKSYSPLHIVFKKLGTCLHTSFSHQAISIFMPKYDSSSFLQRYLCTRKLENHSKSN